MLEELRISGLGVIEEATLPLGSGLTVVTGETGAGKTMVVTALMLLFGARADATRVRTGARQAGVEGRLVLPRGSAAAQRVVEAGGDVDGEQDADADEVVLRRSVGVNGRSRAFAGGAAVPLGVLAELADHLIAVHGQSDQLRLTRPGAQRAALDHYAGHDLGNYEQAYAAWRRADAELTDRTTRAAELRREADLLTHGLAEIDAVAPEADEADELTRLAARLGHADALTLAARAAHDALLGDADDPAADAADVLSLLARAGRALAQQQGDDPDLDALSTRLGEVSSLVADVGADLGAYAAGIDNDPARLEQVEARRATLAALIRTSAPAPAPRRAGVRRGAAAARPRRADLDVSDEAIAALRERRDAAAVRLAGLADALSTARVGAGARLGAAGTAERAGLALGAAGVAVDVRPRTPSAGSPTVVLDGRELAVGPDGADEVELRLRPHPGAPALPIGRGASGGELSRIMLALEVCLVGDQAGDGVPTLVFDEVDAGVGGRAAVEVGRRLARLARDRQVLVVTHLAQVAAFADRHVIVDKPGADGGTSVGVTASDVRVVTDDERVLELARMLAGSDTATAREHAAELLADAAADRSG
ncbi:DNA repair protein RecN [uncultured Jatrophihabitans sp.]|uniref:DNA repair protein RecN n=1 Tax=uncultured Jatrophihabitans sp. TaxID=1610747 RepID=UPI0035CA21FB